MIAFKSGSTDIVTPDANGTVDDIYVFYQPASVPAERTFGLGGTHGVNGSTFWSDPVNTATGAFTHQVTDLSLPGIGPGFVFTRTYTSADAAVGPLGRGWSHSYGARLAIDPGGALITLVAGDGQRVRYAKELDGSWVGLDSGTRSILQEITGGYRVTTTDQVRHVFDSAGKLTAIKDRNDNNLTLAYDASGHLDQITDTVGRAIDVTSNASGGITALEVPDGRSLAFSYTGDLLTGVTDVRGNSISYVYEAGDRLEKIINQAGDTEVRNVYDSSGRVVDQFDALGNQSSLAWNTPSAGSVTMTDARGNDWVDVYEGNVLQSRTDPLGNTTTFVYDDDLNVEAVTDARGNTWRQEYDAAGNVTKRVPPAPFTFESTFTYDADNNLTSATDGRGNTTTYDYNAAGNLIEITEPASTVTTLGRSSSGNGLLTSVTDPRGKTTTFDYDADGNLTSIISPLGNKTTMDYDAAGRLAEIVEPRGNAAGATPSDFARTFTYDDAGNVLSETDALGNVTTFTYDLVNRLADRTDPNSHTTAWDYNAAGELTTVTAPDLTTTTYAYDDSGNLTGRTDANTHTTTYAYDAANRLTSVTSPISQLWTYDYDEVGNLTELVDAAGNATPAAGDGTSAFTYDELNRLTAIDYSDLTPDVALGYDANGNRTSMTDGAGSETYTYDALDRLTSLTRAGSGFAYAYDPAGNLTSRTYPDGTVVTAIYDHDGRMASVASAGQTTTYAYDAAANLTGTTFANGISESRTFDRAGRLVDVRAGSSGSLVSLATYTLDPAGNPTSVLTRDGLTTFDYDDLDRLTEACFTPTCAGPIGDPFVRYTYDGVGNRATEQRASGTTTYTYSAADQLTQTVGPSGMTLYAYDPNGNQIAEGARTFTYDLANRLTGITDPLAGGLSTTQAYSYDGETASASRRARSPAACSTPRSTTPGTPTWRCR